MSIHGRIHGVKICTKAPSISHLFFADDALYFFKAAKEEATSSQQVNFQKSDIFFSRNTNESVKKEIVDIFHLGLPAVVGRSKKSVFTYIHDRVIAKINSWKCTSLSPAGREVLLKTVVQSIPTYVMNMFLLPSNICEPVERAMNGFLWKSGTRENQGIRWVSWQKVCVRKEDMGLGFQELHYFNIAMLAKTGWNMLTRPEALVSKLFQARYYHKSDFLYAELGQILDLYGEVYVLESVL
ncbi:hypothetical protein R3W88_007481 [Solanum pinnatisectum]|uniref:Uncharacterized protein n=1 Tax=Solanum pinnatisectum TaxID=50273 RepID=A0AAV9M8M4_9SOLN|nr:hypothetical protein R3W88_007481 [Solanum pinnatisectum]